MDSTADCPCTKSEIEVFDPVNVQVISKDGKWHTLLPVNGITANSEIIDFAITGVDGQVVDLAQTSIYIKGRIVKANGSALGDIADVKCAPVNNFLGSLFKHVDLTVNGQLLTRSSREYAYKDFFVKTLNYQSPQGGKERTQTDCYGYYPDNPPNQANQVANNTGAEFRKSWIAGSGFFELQGPVTLDLFNTERLMFPGVDMHVKFHLNDPKFFLMDDTETNEYKFELIAAELHVRRQTIVESKVKEMLREIATKDAIYPFIRREITTYTIPAGVSSSNRENIFRGLLGNRYFIGMVDSSAFNGTTISGNPFCFQPYDIREIALMENDQTIAGNAVSTDFKRADYLKAYYQLLSSIGAVGERALYTPITKEHFANNMTIFCFTRSPDLEQGEIALPRQMGNLTLRLKFGTPLTSSITCIIMGEFDSRITLNADKTINTDYSI